MADDLPPMKPEIVFRTASGRVLTDQDIEELSQEAEHGYEVNDGDVRQFECCSYRDVLNGACPCPNPKHAGDGIHPLAGVL